MIEWNKTSDKLPELGKKVLCLWNIDYGDFEEDFRRADDCDNYIIEGASANIDDVTKQVYWLVNDVEGDGQCREYKSPDYWAEINVPPYRDESWIIQRCINPFKNERDDWDNYYPEYENWGNHDPMTHEEALLALKECEEKWPKYKFRECRLAWLKEDR